ncbi:hypothetical protein E2C01_057215 [Portunus trituberculatus]|uniref:Uncharacterized protein n=1 Tax=Portunus trituberculatus TaxID=210409 RepID=A0A5B7GSD5_PORTR|nr:hypothetical protein [Portunus trituberculatus]
MDERVVFTASRNTGCQRYGPESLLVSVSGQMFRQCWSEVLGGTKWQSPQEEKANISGKMGRIRCWTLFLLFES